MKTLTINVPDEMDAEVATWEDGATYDLSVVQTAPDTFELQAGVAAEPAEEVPPPAPVPPTVAALAE